jgi:hypothetical protein
MPKAERALQGALQVDSSVGLGHTIQAEADAVRPCDSEAPLAELGIGPKGRRPDRVPGTFEPGERERRARQLLRCAATGFMIYRTPRGEPRLAKLDGYERAFYRESAMGLIGRGSVYGAPHGRTRPRGARPRSRRPRRTRARASQSRAGPDSDPGDAGPGDGEHAGAGRSEDRDRLISELGRVAGFLYREGVGDGACAVDDAIRLVREAWP